MKFCRFGILFSVFEESFEFNLFTLYYQIHYLVFNRHTENEKLHFYYSDSSGENGV